MLIRTSQSAEFVHVDDPAAVLPGVQALADDRDWLHASDQPAGCSRFRVRPLSPDEYRQVRSMMTEPGDAWQAHAVELGVVAVDGMPFAEAGVSFGLETSLAALVLGVTNAPLAGRRSRSTAAAPAATSDGPA